MVDDELRFGVLVDEADDVGQLARVVRARRASEHDDVAGEPAAARVGDEAVGAPQQRALARARRADHEQDLAGFHVELHRSRSEAASGANEMRNDTPRPNGDRLGGHAALQGRPGWRGGARGAASSASAGGRAARASAAGRRARTGRRRRRRERSPSPTGAERRRHDAHEVGRRQASAAVPDPADAPMANTTAAPSPSAPTRPRTAATVSGVADRARRRRRPARAATPRPTNPRHGHAGSAPLRAKPRESIDSDNVTARSSPLSRTGTTWRTSRPRRTMRPPVRARSASRTSWIARASTARRPAPRRPRARPRRRPAADVHELVVRDHRVERAEHRHHPDDGEALGERLQHHRQLDRAAHGEPAEQLRQRELRGREQHVADAVGGGGGEHHAHHGEQHADGDQDRERARVRAGTRVHRHRQRTRSRSPARRRPGSAPARSHAAAASAQTSQTPACHGAAGRGVPAGRCRRRCLRGGRHVLLRCSLDSGCAQPGCCVRFPGPGSGTGEVGARPTLTRNCERLCGTTPHSVSQATCRCPPGHRCSRRRGRPGRPTETPSWTRGQWRFI